MLDDPVRGDGRGVESMSGVNQPLLIGVYGRARSGKDTAADYLAAKMSLSKYAFAEPLKQMLKSVFGDHFHNGDREQICKEAGLSYRQLMQLLGTEWGRNQVNPQLWVNLVAKRWDWVKEGSPGYNGILDVETRCSLTKGMILSDVRFDSEAEWIKSQGGVIIEVTRPDLEAIGISGHQSEQGINPALTDITVKNDRDLPHLYATLDGVVERYLSRI